MLDEQIQVNRTNWNERTPVHAASESYDVERFKAGRSTLHDVELDVSEGDEAFSLGVLSEASLRMAGYGLRLNGPYAYNVTSEQDWVNRSAPDGYVIEVGGAELLLGLELSDWPNAVAHRRVGQGRREAIVAVVLHRNKVAGVASATTDSDTLWQICIDVHSHHKGRGLGAALTSQTARAVLDESRVPYYGSSINNIASRRTAQSAGFYPCWVSVFTTAV